ncbi:MAG: hypothetical protein ONB31_09890 [candidate division KSB1 bacterium]|nr:hypothetical protein [candidate division KSB1 bacterium]MDZ7335496.1 hypothetical protein [candidate division KSB1 bacterium]MDZ7358797.1 hypothetical protein [candidate division KSB1 bacterium]MDZ7399226.1 hypothetical protein [candidate division KSB1 bacterium]
MSQRVAKAAKYRPQDWVKRCFLTPEERFSIESDGLRYFDGAGPFRVTGRVNCGLFVIF